MRSDTLTISLPHGEERGKAARLEPSRFFHHINGILAIENMIRRSHPQFGLDLPEKSADRPVLRCLTDILA
jgi:hypothetical protein